MFNQPKLLAMITANLNQLELLEFTAKEDPKQHCKVTFPVLGTHGSQKIASVYFELEPGDNVGRHTDSAEELLLIMEGEVEASIGDEIAIMSAGSLAVVPTMVPHDVKNIGTTTVRVLGVFGGENHIIATFDKGWLPEGEKVVSTAAVFEQA